MTIWINMNYRFIGADKLIFPAKLVIDGWLTG